MTFKSEENLRKFLNTLSVSPDEIISVDNQFKAINHLKAIVNDLFANKMDLSVQDFSSDEFSLNQYDKKSIIELIKFLERFLSTNSDNLRFFSIFLLHHDADIRNITLETFSSLLQKDITFSSTIYEIVLSSMLVDVQQKTSENFAIFLAQNGNTRLIDYLVENLYYEIYLKEEVLRKDKERIKLSFKKDVEVYLKDWERDARYRLMLGEKITKLVASADCGEYQDALLEGKGVIEFTTCVKALIEYGDDLYLPSLSGLMNRTGNETHLKWLKLLSVIQGNNDYIKDLSSIVNKNDDENFSNYAYQKLNAKSIKI
ncbi:MAG: hypothetical protein ACW981_10175 [Candidatus Hodarchaeales archaeon]|jgi:hypothetical protein